MINCFAVRSTPLIPPSSQAELLESKPLNYKLIAGDLWAPAALCGLMHTHSYTHDHCECDHEYVWYVIGFDKQVTTRAKWAKWPNGSKWLSARLMENSLPVCLPVTICERARSLTRCWGSPADYYVANWFPSEPILLLSNRSTPTDLQQAAGSRKFLA